MRYKKFSLYILVESNCTNSGSTNSLHHIALNDIMMSVYNDLERMWKEWSVAKLKAQFCCFPRSTRSEYWSQGQQLNPGPAGALPHLTAGLVVLLQNHSFWTMMIPCQGNGIKLHSSAGLTNIYESRSNEKPTSSQHLCRTQNGSQLPWRKLRIHQMASNRTERKLRWNKTSSSHPERTLQTEYAWISHRLPHCLT